MRKSELPEFIQIKHEDKVALIDVENKVCLGVSNWFADNLDKEEVQNKLYSIWNQQVELQGEVERQHERINTAYLMVTRQCNMNCAFCAMDANNYIHLDKEFSISDLQEKIVPFFQKCRPRKLIVTGGEPLIKDKIIEIIEVLYEEIRCPIILQSNGLIINQDIVNGLKGKIVEIDFSTGHMFENSTKENEIKKHIEMCQRAGINVVLSFMYEKTNKMDFYKVIDIVAKYNTGLLVNFVAPVGRAKENSMILTDLDRMKIYLEIAEYIYAKGYKNKLLSSITGQKIQIKKACGGYGKVMAVFPEGDIYMCQSLAQDDYKIGNILTDTAETVISEIEKKLQEEKIKQTFCVDYKKICNQCEYRYICSGKCYASSIEDDFECYFTKNMINYQLFYRKSCSSSEDELKEYIMFLQKLIKNTSKK